VRWDEVIVFFPVARFSDLSIGIGMLFFPVARFSDLSIGLGMLLPVLLISLAGTPAISPDSC